MLWSFRWDRARSGWYDCRRVEIFQKNWDLEAKYIKLTFRNVPCVFKNCKFHANNPTNVNFHTPVDVLLAFKEFPYFLTSKSCIKITFQKMYFIQKCLHMLHRQGILVLEMKFFYKLKMNYSLSLSLLSSLTLILAQIYVVLWSDIQKSVSLFWCEQLGENAYVIFTL